MAEEQEQDLPWWTHEETEQQATMDEMYYRLHPPPLVDWHIERASGFTGANIQYKYYGWRVLDKYRNNEYCHIGDDDGNDKRFIRFLSVDKTQPPQSIVRFDYKNRTGDFANIDDTVMMVKAEDLVNIPPRQRYHWSQYEIPASEVQV